MKNFAIFLLLLTGCFNSANQVKKRNSNSDNLIFTKAYSNINEIEFFKDYRDLGGATLDDYNGQNFGIAEIKKGENRILLFERIIEGGIKPKYQILDTLNIGKLKGNEFLSYQLCRKNKITDCEIIALVVAEDKEFYNKIIKAWRADRKSGKIYPISISEIDCMNEGFGV